MAFLRNVGVRLGLEADTLTVSVLFSLCSVQRISAFLEIAFDLAASSWRPEYVCRSDAHNEPPLTGSCVPRSAGPSASQHQLGQGVSLLCA